eukprot:4291682-Alexandrium_andersonii.AAC.1
MGSNAAWATGVATNWYQHFLQFPAPAWRAAAPKPLLLPWGCYRPPGPNQLAPPARAGDGGRERSDRATWGSASWRPSRSALADSMAPAVTLRHGGL